MTHALYYDYDGGRGIRLFANQASRDLALKELMMTAFIGCKKTDEEIESARTEGQSMESIFYDWCQEAPDSCDTFYLTEVDHE